MPELAKNRWDQIQATRVEVVDQTSDKLDTKKTRSFILHDHEPFSVELFFDGQTLKIYLSDIGS